jgi:hypothetical protein
LYPLFAHPAAAGVEEEAASRDAAAVHFWSDLAAGLAVSAEAAGLILANAASSY